MGLNEVFKKVSAINEVTKLSKHKVDLKTLDDLDKSSTQLFQSIQNARKALGDAIKQYRSIEVKYQSEFESAMKLAKDNLSQFENASKQLGIDPNMIEKYKTLKAKVNVAPSDYGKMQQSFKS